MPQVQVIQRQEDPTVKLLSEFGTDVSQAILKRQALELTKRELDLKAKSDKTEEGKAKAGKLKQMVEVFAQIKSGELSGPAAAVALNKSMDAAGLTMDDFAQVSDMHSNNVNDLVKAIGPQEGESSLAQSRYAQSQKDLATAAQTHIVNDLANPPDARSRTNALDGQLTTGTAQTPANPQSPTNRPNLTLMGLTSGGLAFKDIDAEARLKGEETRAAEVAKYDAQAAPVRQTYAAYNDQMARAIQEMGGLGQTAIEAHLKGRLKGIESEFTKLPAVQTFRRLKDATALVVASFINRGRPTEPDRQAAMVAMPDITYMQATNNYLNEYWAKALNNPMVQIAVATNDPKIGRNALRSITEEAQKAINRDQEFARKALREGFSVDEINDALKQFYETEGAINGQ